MLRLLLISVAAFGQSQPRIAIASADAGLIVGTTEKLKVIVRDANGNVVDNPVVTWISRQPELLRVDNQGNATALGVGLCTVFASSAGFNVSEQLQCIPARIDLQPEEKDITVGERLSFTARALDASGNAIPNVNFNWQVTGANGGQFNGARIDTNGNLTAAGTGLATVRARVDVSGGNQPGRAQWIWGSASIRISPKKFYSVRRLLGSEEVRHSFSLRSTNHVAAFNDNGQAAFTGSLDGLAAALFSVDRGVTKLVAQGGATAFGSLTSDPGEFAINNSGDIAARFWMVNSAAITLQTGGVNRYVFLQGQSFSGYESVVPDRITNASLNDGGQIVFRGTFIPTGDARRYSGLFRLTGRTVEMLVSNEAPLPGTTNVNFSFDQFGIDNTGTVYFTAAQGLYRVSLSGQPERLVGTGAPSRLASISITTGDFAVDRQGGAAVLASRSQLIRVTGDRISQLDVSGANAVFQVSPSSGVLFYQCGTAGCGLYRWRDGAPTLLLGLGRLAPNGEPITNIRAAALTASGTLSAHVVTPNAPFLLMQQTGNTATSVLRTGDQLTLDANVQFPTGRVIVRAGIDDPVLVALGSPESLFEHTGTDLFPHLVINDRVPDGGLYQSALVGNPGGGVYFQAESGIYRYDRGATEQVIRFGSRLPDGATLNNASIRAANTKGALAIQAGITPATGPNTQAYYLVESGRFTEILRLNARAANGRLFNQINAVYLDDDNRVAIAARVDGQAQETSYFWRNGAFENAFPPGHLQTGVMSLSNIGLRAGRGHRILAFGNVPGSSDQAILEHAGDGWKLAVGNIDAMPDGSVNVGFGAWDVNAQGEIAFVTNGLSISMRTASGERRMVVSLLEPTPSGDYLQTIREIYMRDDGRIFFTAFESSGRFALYVAEPLP
ncbi:MAG: hypothetical protein FJW32_18520 [Acidobacteria bacterium]|nr:hypothetical protein [Acidobacteriota bacterium]